jgi:hypothetical protein
MLAPVSLYAVDINDRSRLDSHRHRGSAVDVNQCLSNERHFLAGRHHNKKQNNP